jgi:hypothetical protein
MPCEARAHRLPQHSRVARSLAPGQVRGGRYFTQSARTSTTPATLLIEAHSLTIPKDRPCPPSGLHFLQYIAALTQRRITLCTTPHRMPLQDSSSARHASCSFVGPCICPGQEAAIGWNEPCPQAARADSPLSESCSPRRVQGSRAAPSPNPAEPPTLASRCSPPAH